MYLALVTACVAVGHGVRQMCQMLHREEGFEEGFGPNKRGGITQEFWEAVAKHP